jgi:hypothetical protein
MPRLMMPIFALLLLAATPARADTFADISRTLGGVR